MEIGLDCTVEERPFQVSPLGPRKPLKINLGFSPRRRFSSTN
jgi:hypothetical protein